MFSFFKKLFSRHYAIEQFGVLFIILAVGLLSTTGSIFVKYGAHQHKVRENAAIYTRSFAMSKSHANGNVTGLFTDEAHTKVFLLLSFEDMSMMPVDADKYSIIMSGAKKSGAFAPLKANPTASVYVFGSTGIIGLYFEDTEGFPSQLVQIMLQSHTNLTGQSSDGSYDSALIYFNPGGGDTNKATFLENDDWTMFDMYEETVTRSKETELRIQLSDYLSDMVTQQTLITEYSDRLADLGVTVPQTPVQINDELFARPKDSSKRNVGKLYYTTESGGGWLSEDGKSGFRSDGVTIYLDSNYTFSNGFDFNWQDGRILTGYLEQLTDSSALRVWDKYITNKTGAANDNSFEEDLRAIEWKYNDGSPIVVAEDNEDNARGSSGNMSQRDEEVQKTIGLLRGAWRAYYNDKKAYETEALASLLQLEYQGRSSLTVYDMNDSDDVITLVKEK